VLPPSCSPFDAFVTFGPLLIVPLDSVDTLSETSGVQKRWRAAAATFAIGLTAVGCSGGSGTTSTAGTQADHAVGILTETFIDTHRSTAAWGPNPEEPTRTLVTTILYPTIGSPSSQPPRPGAEPDRSQGPYPLIVFAHGLGSDPLNYEKLLRYWAAAGFVVAAPQFPLTSDHTPGGPDAGDVVNQPGDMSFVISSVVNASARTDDTLSGLVDPREIGAAGHSNGAITTLGLVANTCCQDLRVKAAVVMAGDEVPFPLGTYDTANAPPLLLVHGTADELLPYSLAIGMFNAARGPKGLLTIDGGGHESAAGLSASSSSSVLRTTTDFFDAYLRGDRAALTRISGDGQPGVTAVRFDPTVGSSATIPVPPAPKFDLHASAAPTTNLVDGQKVTVDWSGYTPGKVVNILECGPSVVQTDSSSACTFSGAKILTPDPTGHGSVNLQVVTGTVGTGICDAAHPGCVIVVNNASSTDADASVRIPISFGP
jgi:dienelactone hydrolase